MKNLSIGDRVLLIDLNLNVIEITVTRQSKGKPTEVELPSGERTKIKDIPYIDIGQGNPTEFRELTEQALGY